MRFHNSLKKLIDLTEGCSTHGYDVLQGKKRLKSAKERDVKGRVQGGLEHRASLVFPPCSQVSLLSLAQYVTMHIEYHHPGSSPYLWCSEFVLGLCHVGMID